MNTPTHTFADPILWDESEKLRYLLDINQRENPEAMPRLERLMQKHSAEEIAQMCNEHGHLVYESLKDPNAKANRMQFWDPDSQRELEEEFVKTVFNIEYFPTIYAIHQTRALAAHALENQNLLNNEKLKLETEDDYFAYFRSFHPEVLKIIIQNLTQIELTKGCNGPCRDMCALNANERVTHQMPASVVKSLINEYYGGGNIFIIDDNLLDKDGERSPRIERDKVARKTLGLYYATDMADYKESDITAADFIRYIYDEYNVMTFSSTAYSLAADTVEFIYQLIEHGMPIDRISRLNTGKKITDFEKLIEKLKKRAAKDGKTITAEDEAKILKAFTVGNKEPLNKIIGSAITKDTPEKEMSESMVACSNGIRMRAGIGFEGMVMMPTSKLYPAQMLTIPLSPKNKSLIVPQNNFIGNVIRPFKEVKNDGGILERPNFVQISTVDGSVLHKDEKSESEKELADVSKVKNIIFDEGRSLIRDVSALDEITKIISEYYRYGTIDNNSSSGDKERLENEIYEKIIRILISRTRAADKIRKNMQYLQKTYKESAYVQKELRIMSSKTEKYELCEIYARNVVTTITRLDERTDPVSKRTMIHNQVRHDEAMAQFKNFMDNLDGIKEKIEKTADKIFSAIFGSRLRLREIFKK